MHLFPKINKRPGSSNWHTRVVTEQPIFGLTILLYDEVKKYGHCVFAVEKVVERQPCCVKSEPQLSPLKILGTQFHNTYDYN